MLHATELLSVLPYNECQYFLVNLAQILTASFIEFMLTPLRVSAHAGQLHTFSQGWLRHNCQTTFFSWTRKHWLIVGPKVFLQRLLLLHYQQKACMKTNFGVSPSLGFLHLAFCWIWVSSCTCLSVYVSHHRGRRWMLAGLDSPLYCRGWLGLWSPASGWTKPKHTSKSLVCPCSLVTVLFLHTVQGGALCSCKLAL